MCIFNMWVANTFAKAAAPIYAYRMHCFVSAMRGGVKCCHVRF